MGAGGEVLALTPSDYLKLLRMMDLSRESALMSQKRKHAVVLRTTGF